MEFSLEVAGVHIAQLLPVSNGMTAVLDTASFGARAAPWQERMPLVCWALVDDGHKQTIEGVVIDSNGRLALARNCEHFLGYGYPGDDNRWAHNIHWNQIGNAHRDQGQQEEEHVSTNV